MGILTAFFSSLAKVSKQAPQVAHGVPAFPGLVSATAASAWPEESSFWKKNKIRGFTVSFHIAVFIF